MEFPRVCMNLHVLLSFEISLRENRKMATVEAINTYTMNYENMSPWEGSGG